MNSSSITLTSAFGNMALPSLSIAPATWSGCKCVKNTSVMSSGFTFAFAISSWTKPQVGPKRSLHPASTNKILSFLNMR